MRLGQNLLVLIKKACMTEGNDDGISLLRLNEEQS